MNRRQPFPLKKLGPEGVKTLVQWAQEEGWNPGPHDADVFWATDPEGYYGYYQDDTLIAGGAIISYNKAYGFMGLFIVHPEYRNRGTGRELWYQRRDLLISRLKKGAPIGMDGVVAMQPFYEQGGFTIAFRDVRYEKTGIPCSVDARVVPIRPATLPAVMDYDEKCFGFPRPQFMKPWLTLPENKNFSFLEHNRLRGFSIVRKANTGYKIGPLFADNQQIAEELYKAALNAVPGEPVFLDIPLINQDAADLMNRFQANPVFECARMYYGKPPAHNTNHIFGITTFELG
jgi:GNAT superfamily N-acetyltransferase